jgi:hypothetical protein
MTEDERLSNLEFFRQTWKTLFGDQSISDVYEESIRLSELPFTNIIKSNIETDK